MPILTNTLYDVAVYGTDVYDAPEVQVLSDSTADVTGGIPLLVVQQVWDLAQMM